MTKTLLKSFETPDEVREFPHGRFEIVHIGEVTLGVRPISQDGSGRSITRRLPEAGSAMRRIPARCCRDTARSSTRTAHISIFAGDGLLHHHRAARQLGGQRRALRVAARPETAQQLTITMDLGRVPPEQEGSWIVK